MCARRRSTSTANLGSSTIKYKSTPRSSGKRSSHANLARTSQRDLPLVYDDFSDAALAIGHACDLCNRSSGQRDRRTDSVAIIPFA